MGKFNDKRKYQNNVIESFIRNNTEVNITRLSEKLNVTRKTASMLLRQFNDSTLLTIQHGHTGTSKQNTSLKEEVIIREHRFFIKSRSVDSK